MVRRALSLVLGIVLRLFFRRIEIVGIERVPAHGPTLFAINHPNGLVDPLFLLCFAPRPVSFLGKEPLFRMPVIGWFARAMDSIPVHRHRDGGSDPSKNRETFAAARALLDRGGTIAIAPEGTSHSDSKLKPLKTGAARIALGVGGKVTIVPVGLFYTDKGTFRSSALAYFGAPLEVLPARLDEDGEPPRERVDQVTRDLAEALSDVVVEADDREAADLVARTERLLTAALPDPRSRSLDEVRGVRQRLVAGHRRLRREEPRVLDALIRRIDRLEAAFREAGIDPAGMQPPRLGLDSMGQALAWLLFRVAIFLPLALPGLVIHYPAYWLIGQLVPRLVKERDVTATAKIIGAGVFYPLTWLVVGWLIGRWLGWPLGMLAALVAPLSGYAALKLVERFDRFVTASKALGFYFRSPERYARLSAERDQLRADILTIAARIEAR